jgi:hypothetical protein
LQLPPDRTLTRKYLFITGLGRSGSKLIQNVLRLSPDLAIVSAGETKFLGGFLGGGFAKKIRAATNSNAADKLERIADICINDSPPRDVWNDLKSGEIPRDRLIEALGQRDLTVSNVYRSILGLRADAEHEKVLLVDKTPQNLYHVDELLAWLPESKVIHMIRDPRAVLASAWTRRMREYPDRVYFSVPWPRAVYSVMIVFHVAITWRYAGYLDRRYEKKYPNNYLLLRFEDVVSSPESTIRKLTTLLGVEYDPSMASPPSKGSSFDRHGFSGMDQSTLNRWESVLKPWMTWIVSAICRKQMKKMAYR